MSVLEALQGAALRIRRWGWTQGNWFSSQGYCTLGALRFAVGYTQACEGPNDLLYFEAVKTLADLIIGLHTQPRYALDEEAVWAWNDDQQRTGAQVLALLDRAIAGQLGLAA